MDRIEEFKKLSEALIELGCEKKEATGLALNAIFYVPLNEFPSQEDAKEAATGTASDQMMTINTKLDADVFKDLSHS